MTISRFILAASWATFFIYWLLKSFHVKQTVERRSRASRLIELAPVATGSILIVSSNSPRIIPESNAVALLICVLAIGGLAITLWARRTLADNWSADVTLKKGHELIQHGPYRFVRHPIYTGFLSMVLSAAITFGHWRALVGVGLVFAGFWHKLRQEEALMTRHFPDVYPSYKARVKALIPWVL